MHEIFNDLDLNERFDRDGLVTVPLLDEEEIERVASLYGSLELPEKDGFVFAIQRADPKERRDTSRALIEIIRPRIARVLKDYRLLQGSFIVKFPGEGSQFEPHLDPTVVDERRHTSVTVWAPLIDVDVHSGCLHFIRGAHHQMPRFRPPLGEFEYARRVVEFLPPQHSTPIPMKAGEAIIFHPAAPHWSDPNETSRVRVAISFYAAPARADIVCCLTGSDDRLTMVQTTDDYALDLFDDPEHVEGPIYEVIEPREFARDRKEPEEAAQAVLNDLTR